MPRLPGVSQQRAIRAFRKAGFHVVRQGKHIILAKEGLMLSIPRGNPIDAVTMGGVITDAGMSVEQFKKLL